MPRPFDPVTAPTLPEQQGQTFPRLVELMQRLLAPDGCPWDREQSFLTLRRYVLEEACEVIDAIDGGDRRELRAELGDLLLQVVFQAELGRAEGSFGPDDVIASICDKLVRRHPHVFADVEVDGAGEVLQNWERIKAAERAASGKDKKDRGVLGGVARSLPALTRAQRVGEKVARVGFDWPDARGSRSKVSEEIAELDAAIAAGDKDRAESELGDALFALVNLARHLDVDAEGALRRTIDKFTRRFDHVEARVREKHGGWPTSTADDKLTLEELDGYWDEAKRAKIEDPSAMSDDALLHERDGAVLVLTLNRPRAKNALDRPLVQALGDAIKAAGEDPDVRAVVLTGAGGAFCSGADLKAAMAGGPDMFDAVDKALDNYHAIIRGIIGAPKPVIAAVDGPAVGFGCDLALACDLRLVSDEAYFQEKFVKIGLIPDGGGTFWLPRLVGLGRAMELMFTGEPVRAERAVAIGLANQVYPAAELRAQAMRLAHALAKGPPLAYAEMKRAVRAGLGGTIDAALDLEKTGQLRCLKSSDCLEGIAAWAQKREPSFQGK